MKIFSFYLVLSFWALSTLKAQSVQSVSYYPMLEWDTSPYKSYRFTSTQPAPENWINFRLLFPNGYDSTATDGKSYPLTIILHGTGESARMEWNNTTKTNSPYPNGDPRIENNDHQLFFGGRQHMNAVKNGQFSGFVLFPQNFYGSWVNEKGEADTEMYRDLTNALDLVEYLISNLKIDPNRIILQGISNGGVGSWYAAYKRPHLFAALMPMSAKGDPAMAPTLATIPIWVFQGQDDTNPPPQATEKTVDAIKSKGGLVKYTLFTETGHNTWNPAYQEPDFFKWILAQNKQETTLNKLPQVQTGGNQTIVLPQDHTLLEGTATDEDGSIAAYLWEIIEGPAATLHSPHAASTEISGLTEGVYKVRFTATDNQGAKNSAYINLTVTAQVLSAPGMENLSEANVFLYPNPFSNQLNLRITSAYAEELKLTFINAQGKVVYQTKVYTDANQDLDLAIPLAAQALAPGFYVVQVLGERSNSTDKLTVLKE